VTKLTLIAAERSVARLFQWGLYKQSASSAHFFKTLICPEHARKFVPREMLLDLRYQFINNKCDEHLKKVDELLGAIEGGMNEDVPPLIISPPTVHVLDSGIHVVNTLRRSDSEMSDQSAGRAYVMNSGEYSHEIVTKNSPQVQNVENFALFAMDDVKYVGQKTCPMLSIRGDDLDALMSKSLVMNSPEESKVPKYDINQNEGSKNSSEPLETPDLRINSELETVDDQASCTEADAGQFVVDRASVQVETVVVPGVNEQARSKMDDIDTDIDSATNLAPEHICNSMVNNKDHYCDVDLGIGSSDPINDCTGEVELDATPGCKEFVTVQEHDAEDAMSKSVELPPVQENMLVPAVLMRTASDSNLTALDSPSFVRRVSLPPGDATIKSTRKSRRRQRHAAVIEFDEPKGKLREYLLTQTLMGTVKFGTSKVCAH
jgi:hypothetical protein